MIYRILVDYGYAVFSVPEGSSPGEILDELHRKGTVPGEVVDRLQRLSQPDPAAVTDWKGDVTLKLALFPGDDIGHRMIGASFGALGTIMEEKGLKAPEINNARARFYFTEFGWQEIGRFVAARARKMGHVVKIIRRKNPPSSDVVYRDAYQLALLPSRSRRKG